MRFVSADSVHIGDGTVLKNGVVSFDVNGRINEVFDSRSNGQIPKGQLEILDGILCPGFVNTHCHLELSHLKGKLPQGTGLPRFLVGVTQLRKTPQDVIDQAMIAADAEMEAGGIVLVGDISNGIDSIQTKRNSRIEYHTFVELIGLDEQKAEGNLEHSKQVRQQFHEAGLSASISPHAPYSLSDKLRALLAELNAKEEQPISIHNQETASENELFISNSGKLKDAFAQFGFSLDGLKKTGITSLRSVLADLETAGPLILVHNSCTSEEDMSWAKEQRTDLHWCTCPAANLFIELRNPKVDKWLKLGANVCIGTDSLASNHQLSMLNEMELIQSRSSEITLNQLIKMATNNGAKALGRSSEYGTLESGRKPGILHLSGNDLDQGRITTNVTVKRLD